MDAQPRNAFDEWISRPIAGSISGKEQLARIEAARKVERAEKASVVVAPRGKRPRCLYCQRELRLYPQRRPSEPQKKYGTYGDNRFCGLTCGWRWALHFTKNPIPRPTTKTISKQSV